MISYVEKGIGLHDAVRAAGLSLWEENGQWVSSNDDAVQAIIDGYTLEQAAAHRCLQVEAVAKRLRDKAIRDVSPGEMASWPIKLAEAASFATGGATPMLDMEAAARGLTTADLVAKVIGNASGFAGLEATISGVCGKHRDAIKACTTFEDVAAYDFSPDWPVV